MEKRKRQHAKAGSGGIRWVDAIATGTVTGPLIAVATLFVANRVLPESLPQLGIWEERIFWYAWLASFVHAAWRSSPVAAGKLSPAWREQCWAIAVLSAAAVLLNWATTGDHLIKTVSEGYWPVAALDLVLLITSVIAFRTGRALRRRELRVSAESASSQRVDGSRACVRRCCWLRQLATSFCGMGWLALGMKTHWQQVRGDAAISTSSVRTLRILGVIALVSSMVLCGLANHPSIAVLVWVMSLAAAALVGGLCVELVGTATVLARALDSRLVVSDSLQSPPRAFGRRQAN